MTFEIQPVKTVHSLDRCAVIVRFEKNITKKDQETIQRFLSSETRTADLSIHIGAPKAPTSVPEKSWELFLLPSSCALYCYAYSSWNIFYDYANIVLRTIFSSLKNKHLHSITLGVLDRFNVLTTSEFPVDTLFKRPSPYISDFFYDSPLAPAYSSCGRVQNPENENWDICKEEFQVEASPEENYLVFWIDHSQILFASTKFNKVICSLIEIENITSAFALMHTRNKEMLCEVLQDSILKKIRLG